MDLVDSDNGVEVSESYKIWLGERRAKWDAEEDKEDGLVALYATSLKRCSDMDSELKHLEIQLGMHSSMHETVQAATQSDQSVETVETVESPKVDERAINL